MSEKNTVKYPIVYSKHYDITFFGLEKLHVFDSCKWGKIIQHLNGKTKDFKTDNDISVEINENTIYEPHKATSNDLKKGHTEQYLNRLKWSCPVAGIVEICFVALIPNCVVKDKLLNPFRYQVGGTILASQLALDHQWAINVGGGFHHASKNNGGGFCVYADISIAIKILKEKHENFKFLIVDLDAHQVCF